MIPLENRNFSKSNFDFLFKTTCNQNLSATLNFRYDGRKEIRINRIAVCLNDKSNFVFIPLPYFGQ